MSPGTDGEQNRVTLRSVLLGAAAAVWFATLSVRGEWRHVHYVDTQLPILPVLLLVLMVLCLNPLLRFARVVRPFSRVEVLVVFVMGLVSAGLATMGLASHLVPVMSGLYAPYNTEQSRYNIYVQPYLDQRWLVAGNDRIRDASVRLRDADAALQDANRLFTAARTLSLDGEQRRAAEEALADLEAQRANGRGAATETQVRAARRRAGAMAAAQESSAAWWKRLAGTNRIEDVLAALPARIERLQNEKEQRALELASAEACAREVIERFRQGLPKETERALPGLAKKKEETWSAYRGRFRRLVHGLPSRRHVERAERELRWGDPATRRDRAAVELDAALRRLEPVSSTNELAGQRAELLARKNALEADLRDLEKRVAAIHRYMRHAPAAESDVLEKRLEDLARQSAEKGRQRGACAFRQYQIDLEAPAILRAAAARAALESVRAELTSAAPAEHARLAARLREARLTYASFDASLRRYLVGQIPWEHWLRPLGNWLALILVTFALLMAFNILIFRQWAHHEKITYPLAELAEVLGGARDPEGSRVPEIFRNGLFWTGVAVSVAVMGWNYFLQPRIPGSSPIALEWSWTDYIKDSPFDGLRPFTRARIFFALIGLSFLVPTRITYSLWSFHILHMIQLLCLVWLGYGVSEESFPCDWALGLNFTTAQGGGALLMYSLVMLWKCKAGIFCGLRRDSAQDYEPGERREMVAASWTFLASSVLFVLILHRGMGAGLGYALLYYGITLAITIGLIRAVAEGGLLSFHCWFGPFHFIRSVFGMGAAGATPALFAPLFLFHSVLFLAYKVAIAPAMANALKIRDDLRVRRGRFHGVVLIAILVGIAAGVGSHIYKAYDWGANSMHLWFYVAVPQAAFEQIKQMTSTPLEDAQGARWWMLSGAVTMALLLYFRGRVSWLPHPLGLVMFVNPWMNSYWFSILLGWLIKVLVTQYGNRETYARLRFLFLGLIVGEILMRISGHPLDTPHVWAQ